MYSCALAWPRKEGLYRCLANVVITFCANQRNFSSYLRLGREKDDGHTHNSSVNQIKVEHSQSIIVASIRDISIQKEIGRLFEVTHSDTPKYEGTYFPSVVEIHHQKSEISYHVNHSKTLSFRFLRDGLVTSLNSIQSKSIASLPSTITFSEWRSP